MRPGGQRSHGERSRLRRKQTDPWRGSHRSARRRDLYRRSSVRLAGRFRGIHRIDPLADSVTGRWVRAAITRIWECIPNSREGARHEFCGERL